MGGIPGFEQANHECYILLIYTINTYILLITMIIVIITILI